jgi:hypothetical protein
MKNKTNSFGEKIDSTIDAFNAAIEQFFDKIDGLMEKIFGK